MKFDFHSLAFLFLLTISCSTQKPQTKTLAPKYSSQVQFTEGSKEFSTKIHLPEDFDKKLPLVVIIHEWWGRTPYIMKRSQMLNQKGYATLPVDLFGNGVTADTPAMAKTLATPFYQNPELGIKRLKQYIDQARKDPHVDPEKIFVIGYCFGGTQALNFARSGADVAGVVSFHGGLTSPYPSSEIKARVLALNGGADPMVPPKEVAEFRKEMEKAQADYRVINYPNATHAFTNPQATETGRKFNIPVAYNEKADQASWQELLIFLRQ